MATSVKMSSKHQIVVPLEAREALGLAPGDRLVVTVREDGVIEMEREPEDLVAELGGLLEDEGERRPGDAGGAGEPSPEATGGPLLRGLWPELLDG